jgi:D-apiose dehydrogenase
MTKLKGVCIGTGYFSQFHYEAWSRISEVEIVGICDLDIEKAKQTTAQYFKNTPPQFRQNRDFVPQYSNDFKALLSKTQPDFVDIITPPNTHFELIKTAIAAGVKNIICQKPLAPTFQEAKKLVNYAEKKGVRLMVHENFRFQPWHQEIKRLIREGVIGNQIFSLHWRMRMGDGWQSDAYLARQPYFRTMPRLLIYETGIHFIDVCRFLCGEVESVFSKLYKRNKEIAGEDAGLVILEHQNNSVSTLDMSRFNEPNYPNSRLTFGEILIEGNGGSLRLYADGRITIQKLGEAETAHPYPFDNKNFAGDCVFYTQQHFIECIFQKKPFDTEGGLYLKNLKIQEAVYQSANEKQAVLI